MTYGRVLQLLLNEFAEKGLPAVAPVLKALNSEVDLATHRFTICTRIGSKRATIEGTYQQIMRSLAEGDFN